MNTRADVCGRPTRSMYTLTRREMTRGIANRFVHSRTYILLYLAMAALSVTTVVLSLHDGCPGLPFYVLEFIINTSMILEVGVRFVALGRVRDRIHAQGGAYGMIWQQFWSSSYNVFDLLLTALCAITLLVLTFAGCGNTSKEEALLDTFLLIARNVLQFGRLAAVMRQWVAAVGFVSGMMTMCADPDSPYFRGPNLSTSLR